MSTLPFMGLGLSSNLNASEQPNPWRLKASQPKLFDFVEYSAPLSLDEARRHASLWEQMWTQRQYLPVLFHPVHLNLYGPEFEDAEQLRALDAHARAVGSPWVGNDVGWWHTRGEPFPGYLYIAPPLTGAALDDCAAHADHVRSHLSLPLLLENPAVIAARGEQHVLDFMASLHARTGCDLILDLGHLFSFQLSRKLPLDAAFEGFPFDRVMEIHLAGGVVTQHGSTRVYVDDHTQPVREELFELLSLVLPRCTQLRALTFEGDGHPDAIAQLTLRRLRGLIKPRESSASPTLPTPSSVAPASQAVAASGGQPGATRARHAPKSNPDQLFLESYGLAPAPPEVDADAMKADVDFRLAVVAEAIDRAYPISRLLLAPTREALLELTRTDDFRACFLEGRRSVEKVFHAWAVSRLKALGDPALEAVLAVESFRARMRGQLPPMAMAMGGPVDLSEADFAARALKRHLLNRAWVSGEVAHSGLDALWQVVRRAVHPSVARTPKT